MNRALALVGTRSTASVTSPRCNRRSNNRDPGDPSAWGFAFERSGAGVWPKEKHGTRWNASLPRFLGPIRANLGVRASHEPGGARLHL